MSKLKLALLCLSLGFVFIVLDIPFATNISYPNQYENSDKTIGEYQYYNIASNYGAKCTYKMMDESKSKTRVPETQINNQKGIKSSAPKLTKVIDKVFFKTVQIDIFNDFVGFLLILIGSILLIRCAKQFKLAILSAISGLIVHGIMFGLPFIINGIDLTNASFFIGIIYLAINIVTIYLVTAALLKMIPGPWCRDERKWCKILWFTTFASQCLATFIFWLGSDFKTLLVLAWVIYGFTIFIQLSFWYIYMRAKDYIRGTYEKYYIKKIN
ncbi:MAG: hypothetical protein K6E58_02845 [Eubacterium sp.]|nr:hypothetical protein [Eubacterium sp.]